MEGRWTLDYTKAKPEIRGVEPSGTWDKATVVPVVPCDDAAVERAAIRVIAEHELSHSLALLVATDVLRAAGETP